jgi:hypothetical protein
LLSKQRNAAYLSGVMVGRHGLVTVGGWWCVGGEMQQSSW